MDFWIKAAQLLLSLSILIVLHELGHFLPAKWFKTRVEKFYLFFDAGFSLLKFKKGETEYGIGWLPLGGYVKIAGMIDESLDEEQLNSEPQPWEFRSKPAWQRLIIMIGGVVVNLILGVIIYAFVFLTWGTDYVKPGDLKHGFAVSPIMEDLGFQDGDQVLKIDGVAPFNVLDASKEIMFHDSKEIEVMHTDGSIETLTIKEGTDMALFKAGESAFTPRDKNPILDSILPENPAIEAGFENGDKVISVNGANIEYWDEFTSAVQDNKEKDISVIIDRNGIQETINVKVSEKGTIGVKRNVLPEDIAIISHKDYSIGEGIGKGFTQGFETLNDYITQFKFVFTKKGSTGIGGFGAIGGLFPSEWDWEIFWERTAFISIMLAFMNLLPIPALDGGHVMFLLYEMISGRAPSEKFLTRAQIVGMVILLSLMLYANGLDIWRLFTGG